MLALGTQIQQRIWNIPSITEALEDFGMRLPYETALTTADPVQQMAYLHDEMGVVGFTAQYPTFCRKHPLRFLFHDLIT